MDFMAGQRGIRNTRRMLAIQSATRKRQASDSSLGFRHLGLGKVPGRRHGSRARRLTSRLPVGSFPARTSFMIGVLPIARHPCST